MRVTGGSFKGRKILVPKKEIRGFRPTMDFIREVIFSSISNYTDLKNKRILDLYSGTGIFTFECVSRGASSSHLIEKNSICCDVILDNAKTLGIEDQIFIDQNSVEKYQFSDTRFDIVFADPPYETIDFFSFYKNLLRNNVFSEDAYLVYEERGSVIAQIIEEISGQDLSSLVIIKSKIHGDSGVIIFQIKSLNIES